MRSLVMLAVAAALLTLAAGASRAADYTVAPGAYFCLWSQASNILSRGDAEYIRSSVHQYFGESVVVAEDNRWVYNRSPVFTWATEAKVACGKAIGYFKAWILDAEYVQKCDCYYQRMRYFMGTAAAY